MNTAIEHRKVGPNTYLIGGYIPVPGMGVLPVNAYVIRADEPVLIDTGLAAMREDFLSHLAEVIDPQALRWIWITHTDPDHLGNLAAVLEQAPQARVVTNFLGMGKLGLLQHQVDRVHLLNPGQSLNVGDRQLRAVQPPTYDAPETCAVYDLKDRTQYSSDCLGAVLREPARAASDIDPDALREGLVAWAHIDAPWLAQIDPLRFDAALREIEHLGVDRVLGSHLPPAEWMTETLLGYLESARHVTPAEAPDQAALEQMMAQA
ncbi:MBL fold metallo-hydrolase [Saccharospirillum salsuginis]|uniref:Metallo-beta-lactamase domain-containing protein n=1 Tax=Saccharospirillum salsuginis TaxID=418750 RepID=A0A918KAI7_9GAMM|nr:MBL fold metallo-hydrolase [Saccharospirillum salsuginis]GGX57017.1 hypothetical protein GCM10007392_25640 [Saccharospirillum salsuginis]